MPAHPVLAVTRLGVATGDDYAAAGWTTSALRHALRSGRLVRVAAGRFAPPPAPHLTRFQRADLALARRAVAATIPGDRVAVSVLAGAWLHGLPIWADDPKPCATTWDPRVRQVTGIHLHRTSSTSSLVRKLGVPMTSVARTIVDIAAEFGPEAALVSGDFALRHGVLTCEGLTAEIEACRGLRGIAAARLVPGELDPLAESPLESRGRWQIVQQGLPKPVSQVRIHTLGGVFLGRVDHYWPEGVVGEADGRLNYDGDPDALGREKARQQRLEDVDLEVVRWGASDYRDFTQAAGRVKRAGARRLRRLTDGEPPRWIATTPAGVRIPVVPPP